MHPSILIIEDHLLLLQFLGPHLQVRYDVTTASNPGQAVEELAHRKFDIALLDLKLDKSEHLIGLNLLPIIKLNGAKTIVVSAHCTPHAGLLCQQMGVSGFVDKTTCATGLVPAIEAVLAGNECFPPQWLAMLRDENLEPLPEIGVADKLVLDELMFDPNLSNEEIGARINRSTGRVKNILTIIYKKFQVDSRIKLVIEARRRGYVPSTGGVSKKPI